MICVCKKWLQFVDVVTHASFIRPIQEVVRGGITPSKLSLSIALGFTAGVWPIVGTTSAIALVFIILFPVNGVIVQVVNLLLTAVDIAMVPTFVNFGAKFWASDSNEGFDVSKLMEALQSDPFGALSSFKDILIQGVVGWTIAAPFMTALVYIVALPVCMALLPRRGPGGNQQGGGATADGEQGGGGHGLHND